MVGPDEGKELARLTDAAAIKTTAPSNNVRTAIFTGYLNSAIGMPAGCFSKIVGPDKYNLPWQLAQNTLILTFSLREKELPLPLGEGRVRAAGTRLLR
ncbi:MAG: hypothetical protein DME97_03005 [Verrucomicrobia bacterium]|nr:MAG: hypothetical protein DME97_03005 [Verrucomicrobiota bacterium]